MSCRARGSKTGRSMDSPGRNRPFRPPRRLSPVLLGVTAAGAMASLLVGVEAGLDRLGVGIAAANARAVLHGALMVNGFVGTLIAAERARASGRPLAYLIPVLLAAGSPPLLLGMQGLASLAFIAAAFGLSFLMMWFWRQQPQFPLVVVAVGALVWAGGGLTWLATGNVIEAIPWWGVFVVLTILGERLELTRFARRSTRPAQLAIVLSLVALAASSRDLAVGTQAVGLALVVTGAWLLWADTTRRTVSRGGLARYADVTLLAAYAWLLAAGAILILEGLLGRWYDAGLHALFVGFVIGSIFAHGPLRIPRPGGPWSLVERRPHGGPPASPRARRSACCCGPHRRIELARRRRCSARVGICPVHRWHGFWGGASLAISEALHSYGQDEGRGVRVRLSGSRSGGTNGTPTPVGGASGRRGQIAVAGC